MSNIFNSNNFWHQNISHKFFLVGLRGVQLIHTCVTSTLTNWSMPLNFINTFLSVSPINWVILLSLLNQKERDLTLAYTHLNSIMTIYSTQYKHSTTTACLRTSNNNRNTCLASGNNPNVPLLTCLLPMRKRNPFQTVHFVSWIIMNLTDAQRRWLRHTQEA